MTPEQLAALRAQKTCPTCGLLSPSLVYQALQLQEAELATTQAQLAAAEARLAVLERVATAARAHVDITLMPYAERKQRLVDLQAALAALDADA